jgi:hypothetical protein
MIFTQMIFGMINREPSGRALPLTQTSGFDYLNASCNRLGRRKNVLITEALLAPASSWGFKRKEEIKELRNKPFDNIASSIRTVIIKQLRAR